MLRLTSQRLVQGKSLVTPVWKGLVVDFSTEKKVSKPSGGAKGKKAAGGDDKKHETQALNQFYMVSEKARTLVFEFPEAEQEEHNRIGREYTRQSLIRQNKMDHDLTNKIWLQQEAIRALPEHLREHAMKIDVTPPPADRPWPYFETPPIKGFDIYKYVANESEDDEESENGENKDKTTPVVTTSV